MELSISLSYDGNLLAIGSSKFDNNSLPNSSQDGKAFYAYQNGTWIMDGPEFLNTL